MSKRNLALGLFGLLLILVLAIAGISARLLIVPQLDLREAREFVAQSDFAQAETAYMDFLADHSFSHLATQAEQELLDLRLEWAASLLDSGLHQEAVERIEPLLSGERQAEATELFIQAVSRAARETGDWENGVEKLDSALLAVGSHPNLLEARAELKLEWAQNLLEKQEFAEGISLLQEISQEQPSTSFAQQATDLLPFAFASAAEQAGAANNREEAISAYEHALKLTPATTADRSWVFVLVGLYLEQETIPSKSPVYGIPGYAPLVHAAWAEHMEANEEYDLAIQQYQLAIGHRHPESDQLSERLPDLYLSAAEASAGTNDFVRQAATLQELIAKFPNSPAAESAAAILPQAYFHRGEAIMADLRNAPDRILAAQTAQVAFEKAESLGLATPELANWLRDLSFLSYFEENPGQIVILRPGQSTTQDISIDLIEPIIIGTSERLEFNYTFRGTFYPDLTEVKGAYSLDPATGFSIYDQITFNATLTAKRDAVAGFYESTIIMDLFRSSWYFSGPAPFREVTLYYTIIVWIIE